jgi:hypothetical protein
VNVMPPSPADIIRCIGVLEFESEFRVANLLRDHLAFDETHPMCGECAHDQAAHVEGAGCHGPRSATMHGGVHPENPRRCGCTGMLGGLRWPA